MTKLLAYPLSVIYFLFFGITLIVFHPIQWVCFNVFGYSAHKKSVDILNLCITRCTHILGTRYSFNNPHPIVVDQPTIIVANHQSMSDIPPIIWFMRKYHPKFISKKELGKGIPSVSYNLKHGGSVLIDRKNPVSSVAAIRKFATNVEKNGWAAVIFPEGTRSRDGSPKKFQTKGLLALFEHMPSAVVIPVTINNSWKTLRYGKFPMGLGAKITYMVHPPISVSEHKASDLLKTIEQQITETIVYD
jgi:1-acyl-sn-glycerol-3-phosphate acyltransferase